MLLRNALYALLKLLLVKTKVLDKHSSATLSKRRWKLRMELMEIS